MSYPRMTFDDEARFLDLARARKYKSKADEWLALASTADSPRLFDMIWYCKEPWRPEPELERLATAVLGSGRPMTPDGQRIGRNAPCPCGSGVKFKKCCGRGGLVH